jgi:hypothetical protein
VEVESATSVVSACGDADGFARRVTLFEGKLTDARQAQDTSKVNFQRLSNKAADVIQQWEDAERQC